MTLGHSALGGCEGGQYHRVQIVIRKLKDNMPIIGYCRKYGVMYPLTSIEIRQAP